MANKPISKDPRYNLAYVMQETGIKADTLRAWERRYQLPQPYRTESGHRLFSDFDIYVIIWLLERQKEGIRISRAVNLWYEMENQGNDSLSLSSTEPLLQSGEVDPVERNGSLDVLKDGWLQAVLNFDEASAEQLLTQSFARFPLETVCVNIIQSGLSTIGTMWLEGKASVQQEHFASELANRRLQALISAAPKPFRNKMVLVGGAPGENHTFSMLLITLLLRFRGWPVFYLGANVPKYHLFETIDKTKPDLVVMAAMRLSTAAALNETVNSLKEKGIPTAYGGWIFNRIPGLAQKIPGHYLGGDVTEAVSAIESYLMGDIPSIKYDASTNQFSDTIALFQEYKNQIGNQVLDTIPDELSKKIKVESIRVANEFLAQDIKAALTLGEISLVNYDLDWVKRLISNRDSSGELLFSYLVIYLNAAQAFLHDPADPIIDWLESIIQNKTI